MKVFYILPHCSTGGMPQYALKQVQTFEKNLDITVFEVENITSDFIVQRKQFKNLIQLNGNQELMLKYIKEGKPDIIHFQEVPESFIPRHILNQIYDPKREYHIVVTAHSCDTGRQKFHFLPDKIVTVSNWQKQKFEREFPDTQIDIWEYPIEDLEPTKEEKLRCSDELYRMMYCPRHDCGTGGYTGYTEHYSNTKKKHILNVGLFTPGKNQGELFEIARKNPDSNYHFVGNQAGNFAEYWRPLMQNKPTNCYVWGERSDVDFFYKACDEFYFTSKWELYPICIREALSYKLPIKMHKLETYLDDYNNNPLIEFV